MITESDLKGCLQGVPLWYARWLLACQATTGTAPDVERLQLQPAGAGRLSGILWNTISSCWDRAGYDFDIIIKAVTQQQWCGLRELVSSDIAIFPTLPTE